MPQLVKSNKVPIPVAAATSVFTVIVVVASASFTQISTLIAQGGVNAVPWNVVVYTIPAVIIGGQIGPRLPGQGQATYHGKSHRVFVPRDWCCHDLDCRAEHVF